MKANRNASFRCMAIFLKACSRRRNVPICPSSSSAARNYELGMSRTGSGKVVVVALPMPQGLSQTAIRIRAGRAAYWQLFRLRNRVRSNFFLLLLLVTVFVFFSSVWLAMFLSKQITRPVAALADAMDEIAAGKYEQRVELITTGEMADLVRSFNHMAADLETSRQLAESFVGAADRGQPGH